MYSFLIFFFLIKLIRNYDKVNFSTIFNKQSRACTNETGKCIVYNFSRTQYGILPKHFALQKLTHLLYTAVKAIFMGGQ